MDTYGPVDGVVLGAGVVGLAVAAELARYYRRIWLLEAEASPGTGQSSRNSEVVHAGLYYRSASLKARLCNRGRDLLYQWCRKHRVACRKPGKLVVATTMADLEALAALEQLSRENGSAPVQALDVRQVAMREPALRVTGALFSSQTGIVDSHGLMQSLQGCFCDRGGEVFLRTPARRLRWQQGAWTVSTGGADPCQIRCGFVVNAAGLSAHTLLSDCDGYPADLLPIVKYARGNYFVCEPRPRFQHLIYPVPVAEGLGIHVTLDLAGGVRFGPDVDFTDTLDYRPDPGRAAGFNDAIARYWPAVGQHTLIADYVGIRPKLYLPAKSVADGKPHRTSLCRYDDFLIDGPERHGLPGLFNLLGIESPGLTASLALAEEVADQVRRVRR